MPMPSSGSSGHRENTGARRGLPVTILLLIAVLFGFVNGFNDGGALLSVGLAVPKYRPLTGVVLAAGAVAVAPLLLGTAVAATLASRLVVFEGPAGQLALGIAVVTAVSITWWLAATGRPTSLTLALVGAIAGAGTGASLPVDWSIVVLVLILAAAAPVVGLVFGRVATRLVVAWPSQRPLERRVRRWHAPGFLLQCLAYGVNDGQKMLAVLAVAAGTVEAGAVPIVGWQLAAAASAFLLGAMVGLPRVARTLGSGVVPSRPHEAVITEVASGGVVLATGAVGFPVSMTQAISGGLVGSVLERGAGSIRWQTVARLGMAWLITLPAAFAGAAAATAVVLIVT